MIVYKQNPAIGIMEYINTKRIGEDMGYKLTHVHMESEDGESSRHSDTPFLPPGLEEFINENLNFKDPIDVKETIDDVRSQIINETKGCGLTTGHVKNFVFNIEGKNISLDVEIADFRWSFGAARVKRKMRELTFEVGENELRFSDTRNKVHFEAYVKWHYKMVKITEFRRPSALRKLRKDLHRITAEVVSNAMAMNDESRPIVTTHIDVTSGSPVITGVDVEGELEHPLLIEATIDGGVQNMDYVKRTLGIQSLEEIIGETVCDLNRASKNIKNLGKDIKESADKVNEGINNLSNNGVKVEHKHSFDIYGFFKPYVDPILDKVKAILYTEDGAKRDTKAVSLIIMVLMTYLFYYMKKHAHDRKYCYLLCAATFGLAKLIEDPGLSGYATGFAIGQLGADLFTLASSFIFGDDELEETDQQANGISEIVGNINPENLLRVLTTGVVYTCIMGHTDTFDSLFDASTFFQKCATFKTIKTGVDFTLNTLGTGLIELLNLIGSPFGVTFFRNHFGAYPKIYEVADTFKELKLDQIQGTRSTRHHYEKFVRACNELSNLDRSIPRSPSTMPYITQINSLRALQASLEIRFKTLGLQTDSIRVRPREIVLVGPSSIGKSVVSLALPDALMPIMITEEEYKQYGNSKNSFVVSVDPTQEYLEQVKNGQIIGVVDDLFQQKNTSKDPKICHGKFLIKAINNEPYQVNKAFEDKGEVYFAPHLMIMSTNATKLDSDSLSVIDPRAVATRLENCYWVNLKPEYKVVIDSNGKPVKEGKVSGFFNYQLSKNVTKLNTDIYELVPGTYNTADNSYEFTTDRNKMRNPGVHYSGVLSYKDMIKFEMLSYLDHMTKERMKVMRLQNSSKDPQLTPYPNMSGVDIMMALMLEDRLRLKNDVKLPPIDVLVKTQLDRKLGLSTEWMDKFHYLEPWFYLLESFDEDELEEFVEVANRYKHQFAELTRPVNMEEWLNDLKRRKSIEVAHPDVLLEELRFTCKKMKQDSSYLERLKLFIPEDMSIRKTMSAFWKNLCDHDPLYEEIYITDPKFAEYIDTCQNEVMAWMISDKDFVGAFKGHMALHLNIPKQMGLFYFYLKEIYRFCIAQAQRFALTTVDILRIFINGSSLRQVFCDAASVVYDSMTAAANEISNVLGNSYSFFMFCGIGTFGLIKAVSSGINAIKMLLTDESIDQIANSVLKIKYKGAKPKKEPRTITKNAVSKIGKVEETDPAKVVDGGAGTSGELQELPFNIVDEHVKLCNLSQNGRVSDSDIINPIRAVVNNNLVTIDHGSKFKPFYKSTRPLSQMLFLKGRTGIINWHTGDHIVKQYKVMPNYSVKFTDCAGISFEVMARYLRLTMYPKADLCIVTIPDQAHSDFPDILKRGKFIKKDTILDNRNLHCTIAYAMCEKGVRELHYIPAETWARTVSYAVTCQKDKMVRPMYTYQLDGWPSSCMSPLFLTDDRYKGQVRIIGLHTAGSEGKESYSSSTMVDEEFIYSLLEMHETSEPLVNPPEYVYQEQNAGIPSHLPIVGEVPFLTQSTFSKYQKTYLYEFMGPGTNEKAPSVMREFSIETDKGEMEFNPHYMALDRYCKDTPPMNYDLLDMAWSMFVFSWNNSTSANRVPEVWSNEDAINGRECVQPDSRTSSVGPELRQRGFTKKAMYGPDGPRKLDTEQMKILLPEYNELLEEMKKGEIPEFRNNNFGKSELLMISKIMAGKLRAIAGGENKSFVMAKRLFGDLASEAIKNSVRDGMAMGINPFGMDWHNCGEFLANFPFICDNDYGNYDGHIRWYLYYYFLKWSDHYYYNQTEEEKRARHAYIWRMANSLHIVNVDGKSLVIKFTGGLASGDFLTQLFGSFADSLLLRYNFLMSWTKSIGLDHLTYDVMVHEKPRLEELEDVLYTLVMSDDHLFCLRKLLFEYNATIMQENFKEIGYKYTSSSKEDEMGYDWKTVDKVMFLKRRWKWDKEANRWIAPLEFSSIIHALYWSESMKAFDQVIDWALQETALHGREVFDEVVKKMLERSKEAGKRINSVYVDYDIAKKFVLNSSYAPWGEALADIVDAEIPDELVSHNEMKLEFEVSKTDSMSAVVETPLVDTTDNLLAEASGTTGGAGVSGWTVVNTETEIGSVPQRPIVGSEIATLEDNLESGSKFVSSVKEGDSFIGQNNNKQTRMQEYKNNLDRVLGDALPALGEELPILENVQNMDAPISEEVHVTTVITDEGIVKSGGGTVIADDFTSNTPSDVKDFLYKDTIVTNFEWTTSNASNAIVYNSDIWSMVETAKLDKLYGMNLISADVVITVMLNANPFQAGELICHFIPCATELAANTVSTRNINLTTKTQQPNVVLDCRDSGVEMRIPYITPLNYYQIDLQKYAWGSFFISVLAPLVTGASGSANADVTVTMRFENVKLAAPMVGNSNSKKLSSDEVKGMLSSRSISGGLRTIAKVADVLTGVPGITDYAMPTAWAARTLSKVASEMGYSKPLDDSVPMNVQLLDYKYSATSDGVDMSVPLGLRKDNALRGITDMSIRREDEMSWEFLKGVETYMSTVQWNTSAASNTVLYQSYISPANLYNGGSYASSTKTATYRTGPPIWYLSNLFNQWRGALKLRLKFVKTQFHTGRVQILWHPTNKTVTAPAKTTFLLREIVDIRYSDEVELELPFLIGPDYLSMNDPSGFLVIRVLNELRAPETVSGTVNVLMFWSGGKDLEYAAPFKGCAYPPLQIGNSGESEIRSGVIGAEESRLRTTHYAERSVGEVFNSVKQIVNRASILYRSGTYTATANTTLMPHFCSAVTTSAGTSTSGYPGGDNMSFIGLMYSFYRGSVRITTTGSSAATIASLTDNGTLYFDTTARATNLAQNWNVPGTCYAGSGYVPCTNFSSTSSYLVPYYNDVRMSLNDMITSNTLSSDSSQPSTKLQINFYNNGNTMMRSCGEDFQFGYFIGCPPLLISYA